MVSRHRHTERPKPSERWKALWAVGHLPDIVFIKLPGHRRTYRPKGMIDARCLRYQIYTNYDLYNTAVTPSRWTNIMWKETCIILFICVYIYIFIVPFIHKYYIRIYKVWVHMFLQLDRRSPASVDLGSPHACCHPTPSLDSVHGLLAGYNRQ